MAGDRPDGGFFGGGPDDDGAGGAPPPGSPPPPPGASPPPPPPPGPGTPQPAGSPGGWGRRIIPLHPLTVGDILDGAFKLYRGTVAQVSIAVVIVFGFLQVINSLALRDLVTDPFAFDTQPATPTITDFFPAGAIITVAITAVVTMLVTPLVNGAVTWIAARYDLGEDREWDEGYRAAWSRFGSLLGAAVLSILIGIGLTIALLVVVGLPAFALGQANTALGVIVGLVGAIFLAIPAFLVLAAIFYVIVPAIMVEGATATEALRRSYRLIRPQLLRTIGIVVLAGLLIALVGGVVGAAFGILSFVTGPVGWLFEAVGNTLVQVVTVPLAANIALLIYVDARIRNEGFDIELMAEGLPRA